MIDSFKNFERLRYKIGENLGEIKTIIEKNSKESARDIMIQTVSAILSAFAGSSVTMTLFSLILQKMKKFLGTATKWECFISVLIAIVGVFIVYAICYFFFAFAVGRFIHRKDGKVIPQDNSIDWQKEFDNVACDSIFVAYEYRQKYLDEAGKCQNLKIAYFYEMIHYLEKACNVTVDLCKFKNKYIRTNGAPRGVDVYRLENKYLFT